MFYELNKKIDELVENNSFEKIYDIVEGSQALLISYEETMLITIIWKGLDEEYDVRILFEQGLLLWDRMNSDQIKEFLNGIIR